MLGIDGYEPEFYSSSEKLLLENRDKFRSLIGKEFTKAWVLWDETNGEWWSDSPVILSFNGDNLELCAFKINEFAVTWNTIDMSQKPNWYDIGEINLEWKSNVLPELILVERKTLKSIEVIEYEHRSTVVQDSRNPKRVGETYSCWLLNGLGLTFENDYLSVFNALDHNGISNTIEEGKDYRRIKV